MSSLDSPQIWGGVIVGVALAVAAKATWRIYRNKFQKLPRKKINRYAAMDADSKQIKAWFAKLGMDKPIPETPGMKEQRLKLYERLKTVPDEMAQLTLDLAKRGWYMDPDMPFQFLYHLRGLFKLGQTDEVDLMMASYLHHGLAAIQTAITTEFPERAKVIDAAFVAHRADQFELCVPIFLSQADGICSELLGVGVFSRRKGTPRTAAGVADFSKAMFWSLEPLKVAGAINASEEEKDRYPDILNRHQVLHGKSHDYGTVLNSYRAISLLNYLHSVLPMAIEYREWEEQKKGATEKP